MLFQQPVHDLVDGGRHGLLQLLQTLLFLAENDAGDDVVPVTHLGVIIRGVAQDLALGQVQELHPDGGGADVHRQGKVALGGVAGLHVDHVRGTEAAPGEIQGGGDLEVLLPHHPGQLPEEEEVQGEAVHGMLAGQTLFQAGQVIDVIRQGGGRQFDKSLLEGRVIEAFRLQGGQVDGAGPEADAGAAAGQGAAVQQGLGGDAHHHVADDPGLAGLAVAQVPFLVAQEAARRLSSSPDSRRICTCRRPLPRRRRR